MITDIFPYQETTYTYMYIVWHVHLQRIVTSSFSRNFNLHSKHKAGPALHQPHVTYRLDKSRGLNTYRKKIWSNILLTIKECKVPVNIKKKDYRFEPVGRSSGTQRAVAGINIW